ncbi:Sterile alpha motif containing protein, partial [Oryctes borbonicus]
QNSLTPFSTPEKFVGNPRNGGNNPNAEVEGYGPYKPVPPPKPLPQQPPSQPSSCLTPPPYRMPPHPLYNEPSIPGAAAGHETPVAVSSPATPQNLQTHSSKFPIEREVILSSADKNSKIPILHDYMKKTKGTIAPDVPPKQMAAWTQGSQQQSQVLSPDQSHSGYVQTSQQSQHQNSEPSNALFRASYHSTQEYYNGQNLGMSTGAVPRSPWHSEANKSTRSYQTEEYCTGQTIVQIETGRDAQKDSNKNGKGMTKTYHTIKDIISSKFKSNKDAADDKCEESGLNNVADEMKKRLGEDTDDRKKAAGSTEQNIYGKPRTDGLSIQQHQYNQHIMQQHILAQQALNQQQYQQYKNQQNMYSQQQLMQARSQEMLAARPEEYYQGNFAGNSQRPANRYGIQGREQSYIPIHQTPVKERCVDDRRAAPEQRSAQQIERDNLKQRRAASQPQLAYEDEPQNDIPDNRPQPQTNQLQTRRGSHGNIVETINSNQDAEKDSDDGGFLKRNASRERKVDKDQSNEEQNQSAEPEESKMLTPALSGTPRKRLEGEIGKIEGVYNVGQRSKNENEDVRNLRKQNAGSGASSDYDKPGQSSSNADSGRGSAAYSSGRRPGVIDTNNECSDPIGNTNYRDVHNEGNDSEWVDIVENELRHILEPKLHELSLHGNNTNIANSTLSESISSITPPLPPLSPGEQSSPNVTPRNSTRYKHSSLPYGSKPDYDNYKSKMHPGLMPGSRWHGSAQKHRLGKKIDHGAILRSKQIFGLDTADMTSTTTRSLDLESMLDGQSDSEGDMSTTDARAIRKQLEGLESMYSEVLKLLGVKKHSGRYQPSDPKFSKRRYGSMSSLPSSSVSSRPIRDKRRATEDRKKVRDMRGINKRFQRLESHVVTLARSVAHLSSEMRTQHLMIQEMENIRAEIAALRTQTTMLNVRSQSSTRAINSSKDLPSLANPARVKKLTKFFGDEPPLLRLFLRKLGYEKYATVFENERIGMVELPYLTEERLQKLGVPLG